MDNYGDILNLYDQLWTKVSELETHYLAISKDYRLKYEKEGNRDDWIKSEVFLENAKDLLTIMRDSNKRFRDYAESYQ
mgnify:CR=1 FL=1